MPPLTPRAIPAGSLARSGQPEVRAGGGLVLRPWVPAGAPALAGLYAGPAVQHWHGYALRTHDEALEMIGGWHERWLAERAACWALAGPGGSLAGQAGLLVMDLRAGAAECFYSTAPAFRGRGVAPSALQALAAWAFPAGFHRLCLRHSVANPASCRVAVKSGFWAACPPRSPCVVTRRIRQVHPLAAFRPWPPGRHTGGQGRGRRPRHRARAPARCLRGAAMTFRGHLQALGSPRYSQARRQGRLVKTTVLASAGQRAE